MRSNSPPAAPPVPTLDRHLTYRLHTLNKLSDKASQELYMSAGELPLGEARCLAAIGSFPQIRVNDLAFEANLDKGQASRAAQSLVSKGLVNKTASDSDGRSVILTLTPAGQKHWERVMALIDQRNREIFGCLSPAEQLLLGEFFDRLIAHSRSHGQAA